MEQTNIQHSFSKTSNVQGCFIDDCKVIVFSSVDILPNVNDLLYKKKTVISFRHQVRCAEKMNHQSCTIVYVVTGNNKLWRVELPLFMSKTEKAQKEEKVKKIKKKHKNESNPFGHNFTKHVYVTDESSIYTSDDVILSLLVYNDLVFLIVWRDHMICLRVLKILLEKKISVKVQLQNQTIIQNGRHFLSDRNWTLQYKLYIGIPKQKGKNGKEIDEDFKQTENLNPDNDRQFYLNQDLFVSLFGQEASFLNTPVLLLACDKVVYSINLKSIYTNSCVNSLPLRLMCDIGGSRTRGIFHIQVKLKESERNSDNFERIVKKALSQKASSESLEHDRMALLICYETGEYCVFVSPSREDKIEPVYRGCLDCSVQLCVKRDDSLVVYTGKSVESFEFYLEPSSDQEDYHCVTKNATLLYVSTISQFLMVPDGKNTIVFGLTENGERFQIPNEASSSKNEQYDNLGFCLAEIDKQTSNIQVLMSELKQLDDIIGQVNIFAYLMLNATDLITCDSARNQENLSKSVVCWCNLLHLNRGSCKELQLNLTIQNNLDIRISSNWSLVVSVQSGKLKKEPRGKSQNFTIDLHSGLPTKSKSEFCIPVDFELTKNYSIDVFVYLALRIGLNGSITTRLVPIYRYSFDILSLLEIFNANDQMLQIEQTSDNWLDRMIYKLASERILNDADDSVTQRVLSTKVYLSRKICESLNIESPPDVLHYLFKEETVKDQSAINLLSMDGTTLSLDILSLNAENVEGGFSISDDLIYAVCVTSARFSLLQAVKECLESRFHIKHKSSGAGKRKATSEDNLMSRLRRLNRLKEKTKEALDVSEKTKNIDDASKHVCEIMSAASTILSV